MSFGSKPGAFAMARTSPVSESLHYDVAAVGAGTRSTWSGIAFCAIHWMSRSMVSSTSEPGTAGRLAGAGGGHPAAAGLGVGDLAVGAGQLLVQGRLQAAAALALGVDVAQYPGGEVAVRVHPLGAGLVEHAGQHVGAGAALGAVGGGLLGEDLLQVLDLVPDLRGLPAGEHHIAGLGRPELLGELRLALAEQRSEQRGRLLGGVRDLGGLGGEQRGVGGDVVRVDAGGERDAGPVGDLAALGGQRVAGVAVLVGLGGVRAGVDGLHLEQPCDEGQHDQGEPEADQAQPGPVAAELDLLGGRRGRRAGRAVGGARARAPGGGRVPWGSLRHLPGVGEVFAGCRGRGGRGVVLGVRRGGARVLRRGGQRGRLGGLGGRGVAGGGRGRP